MRVGRRQGKWGKPENANEAAQASGREGMPAASTEGRPGGDGSGFHLAAPPVVWRKGRARTNWRATLGQDRWVGAPRGCIVRGWAPWKPLPPLVGRGGKAEHALRCQRGRTQHRTEKWVLSQSLWQGAGGASASNTPCTSPLRSEALPVLPAPSSPPAPGSPGPGRCAHPRSNTEAVRPPIGSHPGRLLPPRRCRWPVSSSFPRAESPAPQASRKEPGTPDSRS